MRPHIGCRLLVLAALVLVVSAALAPTASAKGKRVSCKGTKVAVKVGKRTTCVPFAKVFPPPKNVDLRLSYLQQALKIDPAKQVKGNRRKRVHSLQSGFGAAGRRLQKKLLASLQKALAFFDRNQGSAHPSSLLDGPALASANCGIGPAGPRGSIGGSSSVGMLGDNGMFIETEAAGLTVRLTFVSCGGVDSFSVPACPKANGSVDAKGSGDFRVTIEIRDGDRLVNRNSTSFEDKAEVHGEVGPDAKLKSIKVTHQQGLLVVATGGIVIRGGIKREIKIDMPAGQYNPASAVATQLGPDAVTATFGADAFAKTAAAALSGYRSAEANWSSFGHRPYCAEPTFTPASGGEKLHKGDSKQLSVYAKALADGGRATEARWTVLAPLNAEFSPTSSQDASPTIQYTVTKTPTGNQVRVTVKVTSTAGVGERTWTQQIESSGFEIEGSFGGEVSSETPLEVPSVQKWTGVVQLRILIPGKGGGPDGTYTVTSGNVSGDLSGIESSGVTGCHQSGSGGGPLPGGSITVTGTGPENGPPYEYEINLGMPFVPVHAMRVAPCPKAAQEEGYEGTEFETGINWELQVSGQNSSDAATFTGDEVETFGSLTIDQHWNLHGSS